jgi:oligopeptide transport system substrate-binding protein
MKPRLSRGSIILSVSFFVSLFLFLSTGLTQEKLGGTYRRPLESNPRSLDPALTTDIYSVTVIQQIFDGLVQFDKGLNVVPAIAKSWKVSPDGLTYLFSLRSHVKFHNGREVTARDFVYSLSRILDPQTRSSVSDFFTRIHGAKDFVEKKDTEVKGLVAQDRYTLKIVLSEPYAPFLSILAMKGAKVVPKEEIEKSGVDFGKSPVGTGPFKLVSMKEGEEILLEANPDYFEGRPYLDRIMFRIFHGAPRKDILKAFEEKGLEESLIPPDELVRVGKEKRYVFLQKPILSLRFYGLNGLSKPLNNKKFRKAINFAVNKRLIVSEIHRDQFNLARSILPPGMPGHNPKRDVYPQDELRARKMLSEGGFGKEIPTVEIWSGSKSEAAQRELHEIQSQLRTAGIASSINFETDWPAYESMLRAHKAPMFIYAWYADFPDPDSFLGTLFHSKSRYNYTAYHNPEVDRLLDKARAEKDYLKRMEMYGRIEEIVLDDAPIVPMVNNLFQMVYQPYVQGVEVSALGGPYIPMKKIWLRRE